jgi:SAM-dependent methyltransferase
MPICRSRINSGIFTPASASIGSLGLVRRMNDIENWKAETKIRYNNLDPELTVNSDKIGWTYFARNLRPFKKFISRQIIPNIEKGRQNLKILDVGVGHSNTPTEPWELLAIFRKKMITPSITVLDIKAESLNGFMSARAVNIPSCELLQIGAHIYPNDYFERSAKYITRGLGVKLQGVNGNLNFDLPADKTNNFEIRKANIVTWDIPSEEMGKYDLAVMMSVAYYFKDIDMITLAFMNLLDSVKTGGHVILSLNHKFEFLEMTQLKQKLNYEIIDIYHRPYDRSYLILKK